MGTALSTAEALVYLRAWSAPEVAEVMQALRRERLVMAVDKRLFEDLIGHKNQEATRVFHALDADADGKVDAFEVLATLALWCCATWEEKCRLLFDCFDFNRKGGLRPVELSFLACSVARAAERFAELPGDLASTASLKAEALAAFGGLEPGASLGAGAFAEWFDASGPAQLLRAFVEEHQGPAAARAVQATIQERLRLLEYRVGEQAAEIEQFRSTADDLRLEQAPGGPEREEWDRLWTRVDELVKKMSGAADSQRTEVAELAAALSSAVAAGGAEALLEPQARSQHGHLAADVESLEQDVRDMLRGGGELLAQLLELRGGIAEAERPEEAGSGLPASRRAATDPEAVRRRLRVLDREVRRRRGKIPAVPSEAGGSPTATALVQHQRSLESQQVQHQGSLESTVSRKPSGQEAGQEVGRLHTGGSTAVSSLHTVGTASPINDDVMAVVVAFAEFVPPASSDTQMLSLKPGDVITALGQEAQGWWYGRKDDGSEGWFPPSYVKLREAANVAPTLSAHSAQSGALTLGP